MTTRQPKEIKKVSTPTLRGVWSRHTEQASVRMRDPVLADAERNYEALDDPALRLRLAREIAQTRGPELTLAYRNVVMVASGFKRVTSETGEELTRTPCVIFVVRRKWRQGQHEEDELQHLPRCLLTYATVAERRVLVAVPTDVQPETKYSAARAHTVRGICSRSPVVGDEYGTLTTLVRVRGPDAEDGLYGLSPLHVLTPCQTATDIDSPRSDVLVEQADHLPQRSDAPTLGETLAIGGQLVPGPNISFDVQLIRISDMAEALRMLVDMPLKVEEPFVASTERYEELVSAAQPPSIELLVPDNNPLAAGTRPRLFAIPAGISTHAHAVPYSAAAGGTMMVHHWELIQLSCSSSQRTLPGDSGAPAVIWRNDGTCTLLGMHIAGDGQTSHVLPAWQLFLARNYLGSLSEDCTILPVSTA